MPPSLPSFFDVLAMISGIPDAVDVERVTRWVKEKYKNESVLEEKVERLDKNMVNINYRYQNLDRAFRALTTQHEALKLAQSKGPNCFYEKEIADLKKEKKEQDDALSNFLRAEKELKAELVGKNEDIDRLMKQLEDLQKSNDYYKEEITKLLDEKEEMLREDTEEEDEDEDDEDSSDYEDEEEEVEVDSDDSDSDLESEDDDEEILAHFNAVQNARELRQVHTDLLKTEAHLQFMESQYNELINHRSIEMDEMNARVSIAERKTEEFKKSSDFNELRCRQLTAEIRKIKADFAEKLDIEKTEKNQALLRFSEETKKSSKRIEEKALEVSKLQKTIVDLQMTQQAKVEKLEAAQMTKIKEMTDELRSLESANHYTVYSACEEKKQMKKAFQEQLNVHLETIKKLNDSEKAHCNEVVVSQNKLVAQLEKNMQLQDEIKELIRKVQNLGVEELPSDDDEEVNQDEADDSAADEDQEDASVDIDYSSDSSFEPIDETEFM